MSDKDLKRPKSHLFDNPKNVTRVIRGLLLLCLVLVVLDAVIHRHTAHPWEKVFAFYPMYGFVACVTLVLLAKGLRKLVMRSDDYYGRFEEPPEDGPASRSDDV